jgi:hypothetical protein
MDELWRTIKPFTEVEPGRWRAQDNGDLTVELVKVPAGLGLRGAYLSHGVIDAASLHQIATETA